MFLLLNLTVGEKITENDFQLRFLKKSWTIICSDGNDLQGYCSQVVIGFHPQAWCQMTVVPLILSATDQLACFAGGYVSRFENLFHFLAPNPNSLST